MDVARLRVAFAGVFVILSGTWFLGLSGSAFDGFWAVRRTLVYYAGILAMGSMSIAVVLAARPVQFEGLLGGLDKFYRLHKWLGIAGLLLALVHWSLEVVPRWMVGLGWLARPARRAPERAAGSDPFAGLRGPAAEAGEWALYLLAVLVILALWKRFPYRYFYKTHRLMGPLYLVLVFHAVVLIDRSYWTSPIGPVIGLLMAAGSAAALASLFGRIGQSRRAVGEIVGLERYLGNAVLDVEVRLDTAWPGHQAGQFAFVTFEKQEGAHPFTVASAWPRDGRIVFSIKGLGDYTRLLPERLRVGQTVTVEGPYGRFDFQGDRQREVWIGGGIGITPFIAGLEARAAEHRSGLVDLVYSTNAPDPAFIDNIRQRAERAGVRFHLWISKRDGLLTTDRLDGLVPQWEEAEIWFCGPLGFGQAIQGAAFARGFPTRHFHQELFDMR